MEQLELHDGQLAGLSLLAARVTSRRRSWRVCSLENMCGEDMFTSHTPRHATALRNRPSGGFDITSICCHGRVLCGRMKELVVPWWRCSHFGVLNLTEGSPSVGGKEGGRYRSMETHCLRLRMLRGQRRTHIGIVFIVFLEFVDNCLSIRLPLWMVFGILL